MFPIAEVLTSLSKKRPVFRNESDLKVALLHEIWSLGHECLIDGVVNGEKVDLWVKTKEKDALIELRYKTRKMEIVFNGEGYKLKNQFAQDVSRYDYIKDVVSLEKLCLQNPTMEGYAILITNDHLYWQRPEKVNSVDKDFRLHEGRNLTGECKWANSASFGTTRTREQPLVVKGCYPLSWSEYSTFPSVRQEFRYLCVQIN